MTGLLLDTNILIRIVNGQRDLLAAGFVSALSSHVGRLHLSTASLWEIALKVRNGKLTCQSDLHDLPAFCGQEGIRIHPILPAHVLADVAPLPATRDPFDRLLLAQAQVEGLRLMTLDRALAGHPLAWQPAG